MSLLPSSPDGRRADGEPRVVDVESEEADEVFAALSSDTARSLLIALHDQPAPAGELAARVDTSVQNVQYHLNKLESAGAVEVAETTYSKKGREMSVYAPADQSLVIFAGDERERSPVRNALTRLVGAVSLLAVGSAVVQAASGQGLFPFGGDNSEPEPVEENGAAESQEPIDGDAPTADETGIAEDDTLSTAANETEHAADGENATADSDTATNATEYGPELPLEETHHAAEAAASLPPGLLFFAGGMFALCLAAGVLHYR